jgi:hypothetical protein
MNRVCITLLLCCLSSCRMNKTERMEMSEDSIDTVRIDQGVGKKTVSDSLKIGIADDGDYLQRQLLAIHEELRKRLNNTPYTHIQRNVTGYGVGLHCIDIDLMVNTPERQKEFREKIMDSPVFCFHGVVAPVRLSTKTRRHRVLFFFLEFNISVSPCLCVLFKEARGVISLARIVPYNLPHTSPLPPVYR